MTNTWMRGVACAALAALFLSPLVAFALRTTNQA